ncbi:hypothetical protein LCGC14_2755460 [marine sediment metagenome]|uniref:Uncharacterized protein n=1 Tax=marine sediment metagenome TaxID=412755 RepID=A0A0F9BS57_9ZZZZ
MISPSLIFSEYLIDEGIFTDSSLNVNWPMYISTMPDADTVESDVGTIYDTEGLKDGRIMVDGENIFHKGNQIRIRSKNYADGWAKAEEVIALFEAVADVSIVINSITYEIKNVTQTTSIIPLGVEEGTKRRDLFTINFLSTIKEVV